MEDVRLVEDTVLKTAGCYSLRGSIPLSSAMIACRLMVGPLVLSQIIGVRVPASKPVYFYKKLCIVLYTTSNESVAP